MWSTADGKALVLLSTLLSSLSLLFLLLRRRPAPIRLHLPPSPSPSLPFLGNLLHVPKLRSSLQSLREQLGPIFTLHVGSTPLICITSAALAHEALVQKGLLFAGRPMLPSRVILTNNFRNINAASYGPYWRAVRRNLVHEMLTVPKILSFKPARSNAVEHMISHIRSKAQHGDGSFSVYPVIRAAISELLLFMCFGFHVPEADTLQMIGLVDAVLLYSAGTLQDYYYYLRLFYVRKRQRAFSLADKQVQHITSLVEKHNEFKQQGQLAPGSYLETLLCMHSSNISLSTDDIVAMCTEFLGAGTDTSATALEWALAHIIEHPSVQSKLYNEMCDVVGNMPVKEEDLSQLPYLQAIIKETLRLHPPLGFLLPHCTSELCNIGGYDIPANAIVLFSATCIAKEPETWEEPLKFQPERFLSADVDITGSKEVTMIPFGAGRRICPGIGLAFIHMELFVACLVQAFEWSIFPSGSRVDLSERLLFTTRMKHPLKALVKERRSGEDAHGSQVPC